MVAQRDVESYLRSADYNLLNSESGFIVADKPGLGGDRDTLLVWLPAQIYPGKPFSDFEPSFADKIEEGVERYPDARCIVLVDSLEGISRAFSELASGHGVKIRVPVQFFDAPFRVEESPEAASAIKDLRDPSVLTKRVPQPYAQHGQNGHSEEYRDLLIDLRKEMTSFNGSCVRFIVGNAGAGKSVLFHSLFAILYRDFIDQKNRLNLSQRPVPFIPQHLRTTYSIRTLALVDSFLRSDVAAPVSRDTLEWMLTNGHCIWMFDGLDELYSGDPEFFDYLLDLLTRPESRAKIVVCARDSLLSSNDTFVQFLKNFAPGADPSIRIYQLNDWDRPSKRYFAWLGFEGRSPIKGEADPISVASFLAAVDATQAIRELSGVPYYCALLLERAKQGGSLKFDDEFELLSQIISTMQSREIEKGLILPDAFEANGLDELLETIATDFCVSNYAGTSVDDIRVYSEMVLRPDLPNEHRQQLITSLVQFPLFSSGAQPGIVSFKHELLAEYLFGRQLAKAIKSDPTKTVSKLVNNPTFCDTLAFRYLVKTLRGEDALRRTIIEKIAKDPPADRVLRVLLQLWLSSASGLVQLPLGDFLEGRNLAGTRFVMVDLSNRSLRRTNLTDVSFSQCVLSQVRFEGARLVGTHFDRMHADALRGAQFGNLENFEYVYVGSRSIEDRESMRNWIREQTGLVIAGANPCSTALQLRELFGKYVHDDGTGRRDELPFNALIRGRVHPGAPTAADCVNACIRFEFLNAPNYRNRLRRATGDAYNGMVAFVQNWQLSAGLRLMIDELCPIRGCPHIP